jgi:hypothetical protein
MSFQSSRNFIVRFPFRMNSHSIGRLATQTAFIALGALLFGMPANSQGFPGGDVSATANFTLNHGLIFRASDRDDSLGSANSDDGNQNYDRGLVSSTSSLTAEFELTGGNLGLFVRMHGFVDFETLNGVRERTPLSDAAKDVAGQDFRLLDLYASGTFDPGGVPLDLRVGNQVLNWGESTFIPNGINVINPIDVNRLRTPGSELRDALVPVPMVYAAVEPVPDLSVEGFYQFGWEKTVIDPVGTYFSSNDYVGAGGREALLALPDFDDLADAVQAAPGVEEAINADIAGLGLQYNADDPFPAIGRDADREPPDDGQYGIALRYLSPALNDAEFGFYFVNAHSRLPLVTGQVPTFQELRASLGVAGAISQAGFDNTKQRLATLEAIGIISNMLPPNVDATSPQGQEIIRQTLASPQGQGIIGQILASPKLQAQFAELQQGFAGYNAINRYAKAARYFVEYPEDLRTVGASFNTVLGASGWALQGEYSFHPDLPLQREEQSLFAEALTPIGCYLDPRIPDPRQVPACKTEIIGQKLNGHVRRDVSQAQVTATQVFGSLLGSDSTGFIAEAAAMMVHDMPDSMEDPLDTAGARGDIADATSWGYRGAVWLDYHNAIGAARLTPYLQFQHDVSGSSPAPFGPFVEGRRVVTLGVGTNYLERMSADVSYTMHAGHHNALEDRDFVSISFNYSF